MSKVTNAILHMAAHDDVHAAELLADVNRYFGADGPGHAQQGFVLVDDPSLPDGWYGGSKKLECYLAIGAFNHLNLDGLVAWLEKVNWAAHLADCQLIVKEQDDDGFRIIALG